MLMLEDGHELLVGCGNKVRLIRDFKLDKVELVLDEEEVVERMVQYGKYVFCLLKDRSFIKVYDITERKLFAGFRCSPLPLTPLPRNLTQSIQIAGSSDAASARLMSQRSQEAEKYTTLERNRRVFSRRRSSSTDSPLPIQTVTAVLIVKDTLWVGMSNGHILVVNIDKKFGDLIEVLRPHPMLGLSEGAVTNLFHGEPGRVVACRDIKALEPEIKHVIPKTRKLSFENNVPPPASTLPIKYQHSLHKSPARCQIQVWEAWGSKDFVKFNEVRQV